MKYYEFELEITMLLQDKVAETPKDEVVISIPSQDSQLHTKTDEA